MANKRPVVSLNTREYDELVAVLKAAREEKGLSRRGLSAQLGRPANYVHSIEQKIRRIDVVEFVLLAEAIGERPEDVFARYLKAIR